MKQLWFLLLASLAVLLAGCGGGGGGGSADRGSVNFFATDDLNTGYSGVWVRIYKVQLRKSDDSLTTIFDDSAGQIVNLRALNDGSNRYAYFGFDSVNAGTYSGMRIELDRSVTLFPTGSTNGLSRVFDDVYGTDRARLDVVFGAAVTVGAGSESNLIADFELGAWEDVSGEIRNAIVSLGTGAGFNSSATHEDEDYKGTISSLAGTAPNFTFVLTTNVGTKLEVETNANTSIFNNNGQPNPTLANGKRVEVRGTFNPATGRLVATVVKIKGTGDDDEFEVKGPPSAANPGARTFKVTVREASGFIPLGSEVNVVVNNSTTFFGDHGILITEAQFFAMLPSDSESLEVEVEGSVYDSNTNTLTARKCKIEDESEEGEIEARGTASNLNSVAGTFTLTLQSWEGFSASVGQQIGVQTSLSTEFKDAENNHISQAQFFAQLATAAGVKVEGRMEGGVIVATEATLRVAGGGGGENPHEIKGPTLNVNVGTRSFTLILFEWFGFNGTAGTQVNVVMNANATYRDDEGAAMTEAQFFQQLALGIWIAEVEGTYNSQTNTFTGVKAKLDDD